MFETMREYSGIGLAAPQVHEGLRLFVAGVRASDGIATELTDDTDMPFITLINPEVTPVGVGGDQRLGRLPQHSRTSAASCRARPDSREGVRSRRAARSSSRRTACRRA